jgi:hypothetical protein
LAALILALGLVAATPASPAGATESSVFAGACTITLTAHFSTALDATARSAQASLSGTGTCVMNGIIQPLGVTGTLFSQLSGATCRQAWFSGLGGFYPNDSIPANNSTMQLFMQGGTALFSFDWNIYRLVGAATMVQNPTDVQRCATGGSLSQTSWTGVVPFEDPTVAVDTATQLS